MTKLNYDGFLESKIQIAVPAAQIKPTELHPSFFPHQKAMVEWALAQGRTAYGIELNSEYFASAVGNCRDADMTATAPQLFAELMEVAA